MAQHDLFPYIIEVVVEQPVNFEPCHDMIEIVVPTDYSTPNGTLFKARGLQYALENSTIPNDAWIMHCDEESHIHESLVVGMAQAIEEEEATGNHRIGQGCIVYHHTLDDHPFFTLADSVRSGDDVGRWNLQNRLLGKAIWGLHGSFILVRNSVEREVGFDFGPEGSITEDAFWALCEMERGYRTRWVDGFMVEQAPENALDLVKQRSRWFIGLVKVVKSAPVRWWWRAPLAFFTGIWMFAWLGVILAYVNLFMGFEANPIIQFIGNLGFACFITIYIVGLRASLQLRSVGLKRSVFLYAAQVLCIPAFAVLESAGVIWGMVKRDSGFHVIQKRH